MSDLEIAKEIAKEAHAGEFRKDGVTPYLEGHVYPVAEMVAVFDPSLVSIALLHDVLENSKLTREDLLARGLPLFVVETVVVLTKKKDEDYDKYLERVAFNRQARPVKIANIVHNLGDDPSPEQVKKYAKALKYLLYC